MYKRLGASVEVFENFRMLEQCSVKIRASKASTFRGSHTSTPASIVSES